MSRSNVFNIFVISFATAIINSLVWLPHLFASSFYNLDFSQGFNTIFRNYDGLEYVIIAKTFYDPALFPPLPQSLPASYYASHFPGYSIFILLFAPLFGLLKSMIFVSTLFTALSAISFYFLLKRFHLTSKPLLLSLIFLVLPARWLIIHSVGSSEPVFIFFTILALFFFLKFEESKKFTDIVMTGLCGLAAQITRPPGILLFIALTAFIIWRYFLKTKFNPFLPNLLNSLRYFPIILIPSGLLMVFYLYMQTYGDFFAYFHSGDNIHLLFPPFQVFNVNEFWVGDIWLEDIIYIFILGFLGGITLLQKKLTPLAFFVLTYLLASIFVSHRDISRYVIPVFPFILVAFEKILVSKEFKIVLFVLLLGIYLYAQNFILQNTAPFPNPQLFD